MKNIKHIDSEFMHTSTLDSGIKCYFIPKKGFVEKQAAVAINYGSVDNTFSVCGEKKTMPAGIAHYLEHKMFEDKDGSVFDKFSKYGATVNAFTSSVSTAYYFNCTDNFNECLGLLLDFIKTPYFTDENVDKERGIIEQEINMYKDDPAWAVYLNMLEGLYHNRSFKENIAGNAESIGRITKELLMECYENFYTPENMALICCGDLEAEDLYHEVNKRFKYAPCRNVKRIIEKEPAYVNKKYIEKEMPVSLPLFYLGFKDNDYDTEITRKTAAMKTLIDCVAGESSSLYERMYDRGLINNNFTMEYVSNKYFGSSIFSGFSKDPALAAEKLLSEIKRLRKTGILEEHFERIKKKHIGRFIRGFNSIEALTLGQADYFSKETDIFEAILQYEALTKNQMEEYLRSHFTEDSMTLSVVKPC